MTRLVLLGASNVRRGLPAIARLAFGGGTGEISGALGHGRSYGKGSCVPFRCLPGILECGLWRALGREVPDGDAAVIADVGNDILYGESPATILGWVAECVRRAGAARITIVGLPLDSIRRLGAGRFLFFRSVFFPGSRVSRRRVVCDAEEIDEGLRRLAERSAARFVAPDPGWYGADPIHIHRDRVDEAWRSVLGTTAGPAPILRREALRLRLAAPERRWICGIERIRPQPAWIGPGGACVKLY